MKYNYEELQGIKPEGTITSIELLEKINVERKKMDAVSVETFNFNSQIRLARSAANLDPTGEAKVWDWKYTSEKGRIASCYLMNVEAIKILWDQTNHNNETKIPLAKIYLELTGEDIDNMVVNYYTRSEVDFFKSLKRSTDILGYKLEQQKLVAGYRLDGYLPDYNLAIEWDEAYHNTEEQQNLDLVREREVKEELGCEFIRLPEVLNNEEAIALVLNKISEIEKAAIYREFYDLLKKIDKR